jgi:N-acyl-D-amino-acid deacylase
MRDYEHAIGASFEEAFAVGRASGIRVHISHLNMHHDQGIIPIEAALAGGVDVSFDTYPYLAGSTVLTRHLPGWALEGGTEATLSRLADPAVRSQLRPWLEAPERRWGSVLLGSIGSEEYGGLQGRPPADAAASLGRSITDLVCDLLVASRLEVGIIGFRDHRQNEEDIRRLLVHRRQVVASDGIFVGTNPHPRGFGTFARILAQYVRDEGLLRLEEAIRKMTSATARIFGLAGADPARGTIRVGAAADLVVFDAGAVADRSTYQRGREMAVGVEAVLVNGVLAVLGGELTGATAGKVLRPAHRHSVR